MLHTYIIVKRHSSFANQTRRMCYEVYWRCIKVFQSCNDKVTQISSASALRSIWSGRLSFIYGRPSIRALIFGIFPSSTNICFIPCCCLRETSNKLSGISVLFIDWVNWLLLGPMNSLSVAEPPKCNQNRTKAVYKRRPPSLRKVAFPTLFIFLFSLVSLSFVKHSTNDIYQETNVCKTLLKYIQSILRFVVLNTHTVNQPSLILFNDSLFKTNILVCMTLNLYVLTYYGLHPKFRHSISQRRLLRW